MKYIDGYQTELTQRENKRRRDHPEYSMGYAEGFKDGYMKAIEKIPDTIRTLTAPRVIVTTQENYEKVLCDYGLLEE